MALLVIGAYLKAISVMKKISPTSTMAYIENNSKKVKTTLLKGSLNRTGTMTVNDKSAIIVAMFAAKTKSLIFFLSTAADATRICAMFAMDICSVALQGEMLMLLTIALKILLV